MKKILFYTEKWADGGIESFLINLFSIVKKNKYKKVILIGQKESDIYDEYLKKLNCRVKEINKKSIKNPINRTISNIMQFKKIIKVEKPNVIHINLYNGVGLIYAFISKKAGVKKIICHAHNSGIDNDFLSIKFIFHFISKKIFTDKNFIYLACSKTAANFCFDMKKILKIKIINNGIDAKKFIYNEKVRNEIRKEIGIDNDELLIGNVGRFVEQKNQMFLLNIFDEYQKINKKSKLILIGSGELESKLKEEAQRKKINKKVIFYGNSQKIQDLYQAMDIFLLTSRYEGLGIVVIEAQTSGLKCIVSTGVPEETKITNNIFYKSLNSKIEDWCNEIENQKKYNRKNQLEEILNSGYDMETNKTEINNIFG